MDKSSGHVRLYTVQPDAIAERLHSGHCHYARLDRIAEKYGGVAPVFLQAYRFYVAGAETIVPRPPQAASAIWAFAGKAYLEQHAGSTLLALDVPMEACVFFRMSDWNKVLNLRYIGEGPEDEQAFAEKLARYGVRYEGDVFSSPFYPHLKKELTDSWHRLWRYDAAAKSGGEWPFADMQVGLWVLKPEWLQK